MFKKDYKDLANRINKLDDYVFDKYKKISENHGYHLGLISKVEGEIDKVNRRANRLEDQVEKLMDLIKVKYEEVPAHTRLVEKKDEHDS
jgi:hypothetical protein